MASDKWFERLASATNVESSAPARLKSRIYSALVNRLSGRGTLLDLKASRSSGRGLCVFETALTKLPGSTAGTCNPCRVCHARMLGEHVETAPIFWPNCPYSEFHAADRARKKS